MSVLSPLSSPPATDTQQAVSSEESIGFFFRERHDSIYIRKQQKCFNCFCMGAYASLLTSFKCYIQ